MGWRLVRPGPAPWRRGDGGGTARRPAGAARRPGATVVHPHRAADPDHRRASRARAVHQAHLGRVGLFRGQRRPRLRRPGLRRGDHGRRGHPRHHGRRTRRARALRPERPRLRILAARPGPVHARRVHLRSRTLRAPPRVLRLAGRSTTRPGRLAQHRVRPRQGGLDLLGRLRRVQPLVGCVHLPPAIVHLAWCRQSAHLRTGPRPVPGRLRHRRRQRSTTLRCSSTAWCSSSRRRG